LQSGAGGSVFMGATPGAGSGFLQIVDGEAATSLELGAVESTMGLYVMSEGSAVQASMSLDDNRKGIVRVGNSSGPRGVIGATRSGGVSLALYDSAGTDFRVGMLATPAESFLRVNSQGSAVHMNADAEGSAVHVFNKAGNAAASMISTPSGFGQLSLGNANGDTTVEAGTTTEGLGVVRAGPVMGGAVGIPGLPFAIIGKK
jgi:hypothetical protein